MNAYRLGAGGCQLLPQYSHETQKFLSPGHYRPFAPFFFAVADLATAFFGDFFATTFLAVEPTANFSFCTGLDLAICRAFAPAMPPATAPMAAEIGPNIAPAAAPAAAPPTIPRPDIESDSVAFFAMTSPSLGFNQIDRPTLLDYTRADSGQVSATVKADRRVIAMHLIR